MERYEFTTRSSGSEPAVQQQSSVLFATIAAGGSHVSTAEAMSEALHDAYPGRFKTSVREPMRDFGFEELDRNHKEGWRKALRNPWSIVWGQRLIDALPAATAAFHRRLLRDFAKRAASELLKSPPDLIVVNHGWLTTALTMAQRRFGLEVPVVTFETSTLNANALWAEPNAERFVVASPVSKRRLVGFGVPAGRIDVVGYPVRRAFLRPPARDDARRALGLLNVFTCLVALGGEGVGGAPERVVKTLLGVPDVQVVVVTGRNEPLRRRLGSLSSRHPRLKVVGFVEDMAAYLAASDVVIGKTGPATVFETLAVGRPLLSPMRFGNAENKMLGLLETHGVGGYVPSSEELLSAVREYRDSPELLSRIERRCKELDLPGMAARLAHYLAHYARTRQPHAQSCGAGVPLLPASE
ncbi:MAG: glycosyltransferase [Trueperaceae bacterium]